MNRTRRLDFLLAFALVTSIAGIAWSQEEAPPESLVLQDAAKNLQDDRKFDLAIEQWKTLIERFPGTKSTHIWRYNLGVCQANVGDYPSAVAAFEKVLEEAPEDFAQRPHAWLQLGYNRWMQAKRLDDESGSETKVQELANAAAASFSALLEKYPKSELAEQAVYFLGEANVTAGALDQAIAAFDRLIVEMPKSEYWPAALYALGTCHEERGDLPKALVNYDRYLEKVADGAQLDDVRFRKAETLLKLGAAAEQAGNRSDAVAHFEKAEALFQQVANNSASAEQSAAAFRRGIALFRADKFEPAAAAFAQFAKEFPESEFATQALIYAGDSYLRAADLASAEKQLTAVLEQDPKSIAAAQLLCRTHLAAKQPDLAWTVAEKTLAQVDSKSPAAVPLLMAQADAAFEQPERIADSIPIYLGIVAQFPDHALAPQALYNAAFSSLMAKQLDQAIELAEKFYGSYKQTAYLADVQEVHAEAALQQRKWDVAERLYRQLIEDFPQNAKVSAWKSGLVQVLVLAGNNDDAIRAASPMIDQLEGRSQAEMLFHVGSAQFQAQQFEPASKSLERSLQADSDWSRADEVALLAARAAFGAGQVEEAIAQAERCLSQFPKSAIRDQVLYRLGEFCFEAGQFENAIRYYGQLIVDFPKSTYAGSAMYGRGWSELRLNQFDVAAATFAAMLKQYPDHALALDATLAKGMALRRGGQLDEAAADLERYLASNPSAAEKIEALYERALIEVDQNDPDAIIEKFTALRNLTSEEKAAEKWGDKCLYELAWAYKAKNDAEQSLAMFTTIVREFPDSPLAAEAHFHMGEAAYEDETFDKALEHYTAATTATADAELREKASYKLAWTHYKLEDYPAAEQAFRKQVAEFPQGPLKADGLFMISESLFRQKEHVAAVTAYKAALPEVQASSSVRDDVKMLTVLHGAQSANEAKQFDEAIAFLKPLVDGNAPPASYAAETWFEYGQALRGRGDLEQAIKAWEKAQASFDKTGIRARCMIAEALFEQKKFDDAIKEFTLAVYGYGGRDAVESVKPWQAFAAYELARCHLVQVSTADAAAKPKLIQEAKTWFSYLIEHYPDDRLSVEAKNQIAKLEKM